MSAELAPKAASAAPANPYSEYDGLVSKPSPSPLPGAANAVPLPEPDVASTSDTQDFSEYDALVTGAKDTPASNAEASGTPAPTPPPGLDTSAYDAIVAGGAEETAKALAETPVIPVPTTTQPQGGGLLTPGNIDLNNRPIVKNADGSISTVRSMSFEENGKEILVPTVSEDGRIMTNSEAKAQYHATGKHLGIFSDPASATAYAQKLHQDQAAQYLPKAAEGIPPSDPDLDHWLNSMGITDPKERALFASAPEQPQGERPPFAVGIARLIDHAVSAVSGAPTGADTTGTLENLVTTGTAEPKPVIPMVPQQKGKMAQTGAGIANVPIGFANFMMSQGGLGMAGSLGLLPKAAQALIGAGFTAQQVAAFFKSNTLQDKITSLVGAALTGVGTVLGVKEASKGGQPSQAASDFRTPGLVKSNMIAMAENHQVFDPIVESIPVNVMNVLSAGKVSAEELRHNPAMFTDLLSSADESTIARSGLGTFLSNRMTRLGAEPSSNSGGGTLEGGAANRADVTDHGVVSGAQTEPRLTESSLTDVGAESKAGSEMVGSEQNLAAGGASNVLHTKEHTTDVAAKQGAESEGGASPKILPRARELEQIYGPATEDVPGFGPGAASAKEPLPKSEPRAFAERFQDDKAIAQDIRDAAGNRFYEPISNKVTLENATDIVKERGIPESINLLKDEGNGLDFRVRSAMGQFIIKRLNEGYRALKESSPADAELFLNQTADLAEWQSEYGTRLGQGVQSFAMWSRITPEGKLLSVKRAMQKVQDRFTQENGDKVRQVVDAANTRDIGALRKLAKKNPIARKLKNQFQDLINASQPQLLTEENFYKVAGDRLGIPQFSPEVAADVLRLAHEIDAALEGMPRDKATLELSKYIANLKGFAAKDVPIGIYYGNMLSGYNTQIVNGLDTFLNVFSEINGMAVTNPRSAMQIYSGLVRGFAEGRTDALLALTEGRMVTDGKWLEVPKLMEIARFGEKGGVPIRVEGLGSRAVKAASESRLAYPLRGWKYVTRLMAASDAVMFRGAKEARMALLADRVARSEGLKGSALIDRVNEILGLDEKALRSASEQAKSEGFTGSKLKAREAELREMSRPKEASADAADFAGEATYNHEPHGVLGYFADAAGKASEKYPLLKAFVPFTRIVANVTNRGLNYTPLGFKRAFYGYSGGEGALVGDARSAMIARATMGTVGLGALVALQESGTIEVHGAGPSDNERRKQLQAAGWKPYSLKIGGKYYSYIYTPLGLGASIIGNMTDAYRYNELSQKDAFTRAAYSISRIGSTIFSQSFLSGLSGLFTALSGAPGDTLNAVKQFFSSTTGSLTTPMIVRDIYRLFDPQTYQSSTIMGDMLRNTVFSSVVNEPALNAFGEPVRYPSNRFISDVKEDRAWKFVVEHGLRVPVPDKYSQVPDGEGGKRRITPAEYHRYLRESGQEIKASILDNMADWAGLDQEEAQKALDSKAQRIRERVKRDLVQ